MKNSKRKTILSKSQRNNGGSSGPKDKAGESTTLLERWYKWCGNRLIVVIVASIGLLVAAAGEFVKHLEDLRPALAELRHALHTELPWQREREVKGQELLYCSGCPGVVTISEASFVLGPDTNNGREETGSLHVDLRPYGFGKGQVTQLQWQSCVEDHKCGPLKSGRSPSDARVEVPGFCPDFALREAALHDSGKAFPEEERKKALEECSATDAQLREAVIAWRRSPAVVSYSQALEYVGWLSAKTKKIYRLPSEAEWEYAMRFPIMGWSKEENWVADCWNPAFEGASSKGNARTKGDCADSVIRVVTLNFLGQPQLRDRARQPRDEVAAAFRVALSLE